MKITKNSEITENLSIKNISVDAN